MLGGEIKVVMTLDNGQFTIATQRAGQTIKELRRSLDQTAVSTQRLEKHFTGIGGQFRSIIQTASMLRYAFHDVHDVFMALPGSILKTSGEFERMTKLLSGMSKQSTQAARDAEALSNVNFVFNLAQNAPFEVKALTDAFVKFKSAGLDPTNGSLKAVVDSVAKFGGSSETLHRASIAIQQMAGKGVISMEELRQQLGEAVPNAIEMMAQGSGMSLQKFTKLVSTGAVEAKTSLNNMFAVMNFQNGGAAKDMMDTWSGMLSLLKTKFELFKKEAGDAKFFQAAKDELADIIALFDNKAARSFALDLGEALTSLVRGFRTVIEVTTEWWGVIRRVGEAFLLFYAADKAQNMVAPIILGIKARIQAYKDEVSTLQGRLADKLKAVNDEIAAEERAFAQKQKIWAKQDARAAETNAKEAAAEIKRLERQRVSAAKELDNEVQHLTEMKALQQKFLGEKIAAEMQAEALMRQKKAGSAAAARAAQLEADRLNNNAGVVAANIANIEREIAAIKARDAAIVQSIAVQRNAATAAVVNNVAAAESAAHAAKMSELMAAQGAAAGIAAAGVSGLTKAWSGLKLVFNALGGWVGMAIAVLVTLGEMLWKYLNRWEEFDKAVQRTKRGIASTDDLKTAQDRAKDAKDSVEALKKELEQLDGMGDDSMRARSRAKQSSLGRFYDPKTGQADVAAYRAALQEAVRQKTQAYDAAIRMEADQKKLIQEDAEQAELGYFQRAYDRQATVQVRLLRDKFDAKKKEEDKAVEDARKDARDNGKKLTEGQEEDIRKGYIAQRNELVLQEKRFQLLYAQEMKNRVDAMIAATKDPDQKRALEAQKDWLRQQVESAEQALKSMNTLGTTNTAAKDPKAKLKENPLVRKAEEVKAAVAEALVKYYEAEAGIKDLKNVRNRMAIQVLGEAAAGKYDEKIEGEDGKEKIVSRVGDINERKEWVKQFMNQVVNGKKSVDAFIKSLGLTKVEADRIVKVINGMTEKAMTDDDTTALTRGNTILEQALRDRNEALNEVATDGMSKESAALERVKAEYDELFRTLTLTASGYQRLSEKRDAAVSAATAARDARATRAQAEETKKYVESVTKEVEKSRITRERGVMNYLEVAKSTYEEELREFQFKEDEELKILKGRRATGSIDEKQYQLELNRINDAGLRWRTEAANRYYDNTRTETEKLALQWSNTVDAMNKATASWANATMDYITKAFNGEKVGKFKDVVNNMLKDLNGILVKKVFGGMITGGFGEIGKTISDALGLNDANKPTGRAGDPLHVTTDNGKGEASPEKKLADSAKEMWEKVKTGAEDLWKSVKDSFSGMWDNLSSMFDGLFGENGVLSKGLTDFLSSAGDWISNLFGSIGAGGGGGDLLGEIASFFAFANGGVMTGSGSVSLKKYANGGVANRPQLAMFGEGATPEAYVPLPDGRSIPVTLQGNLAAGNSNMVNISIVVNKDGETQASSGDEAQTWQKVAQRVRGVVMEELVVQQRPGGVLYR